MNPLPPAEPGVTTSEFQGLVAACGVLVASTVAVLADFGAHFTATQKTDLVAESSALLVFAWVAYGVYRSWRKRGTPA